MVIGRHPVRRLMLQMVLTAVYQRPRASVSNQDYFVFSFETMSESWIGLKNWLELYNERRRHSGLGGQTPGEVIKSPRLAVGPACPTASTQAWHHDTIKHAAWKELGLI